MKVRAQVATVFHLDKCIGCHTCSLACKGIWTERRGAEYMWWNNVETKPGTGYPTLYEDQALYRGGWERRGDDVRLTLGGRLTGLANLFSNPRLPALGDYYEPWTYRYADLLEAEPGDHPPTARPVSQITGREMEPEAGPNWDDDLGGSEVYAAHDPNLAALSEEERRQLFLLRHLAFFYLPRICNHCLNPACLAACPAGAIYKRGEDGIVLVSQDKCRAWRMCISGCPYKKVYFNWATGKSEKCILCYPRQETRQAPACMHACVGRIRYLGLLLYDAERIRETAARPDAELVEAQRDLILDPFAPAVIAQAGRDGLPEQVVAAAQRSPVYQYVKVWRLALPLHPEWRTLPMLFYVPSLLPVVASGDEGPYELTGDLFGAQPSARLPVGYLASLLSAGNAEPVLEAYRKLHAGRLYFRERTVGDVAGEEVRRAIAAAATTPAELEAIYRMSSLARFEERMVVPPFQREMAAESEKPPQQRVEEAGTGFLRPPRRGS